MSKEILKNLIKIAYINPKYRYELFCLLGVSFSNHKMRKADENEVSKIMEDAKKGVFSGYTLGILSAYYSDKNMKFKNPNPEGGKDEIAMSTLAKYYSESESNPEYKKFIGPTVSEIQRAFYDFYKEFERQQGDKKEKGEEEDEDEESDDEVVDEDDLRKTLKERGIGDTIIGLSDSELEKIGDLVDEIHNKENLGVNTEEFYSLAERMLYEVGDDEVWLNCGLKDTPEGLAKMEEYLRDLGFDPKVVFNESGLNEMGIFSSLDFRKKLTRPIANKIKQTANSYERTLDLYGNKLFGGAMKLLKNVSGKDLGMFDPENPDGVMQKEYIKYLSKKFSTKPVDMVKVMETHHDSLKSKIKDDVLFDKVYEQLKKGNFATVQKTLRKDRVEKLDALKLNPKDKIALEEMLTSGAFKKARQYIEDKKIFSNSLNDMIDNQVALKQSIKDITREYYEKEDIGINPEMRRQMSKNTYALMGVIKNSFANELVEQSADKVKDYIKDKITSFNPNSIPIDAVESHITNLNEYNKEVLVMVKKGVKSASMASLGDIGGRMNSKISNYITKKIIQYAETKGADKLEAQFGPMLKEKFKISDEDIKDIFSSEKGIENSVKTIRKLIESKVDAVIKENEDIALKYLTDYGNQIDSALTKASELTEDLKQKVSSLNPDQVRDFLKEHSEKALSMALGREINLSELDSQIRNATLKSAKDMLFEYIPDKEGLDSITADLGKELSSELNPLFDKFKDAAVEQTNTLKKEILAEANNIGDEMEKYVVEKTKAVLDTNSELGEKLVKGDMGQYLKKVFDNTSSLMESTTQKAEKLNSVIQKMSEIQNNPNMDENLKAEKIKFLGGLLIEAKKEISENIGKLKLGDVPDEIKERGFGHINQEELLKKYTPEINGFEKKILDKVLSAESHLKTITGKFKSVDEFADKYGVPIPKDFTDVNELVKKGVSKLNSTIDTNVKLVTYKIRDEGIKMLSEKLDSIKPGETLDKFKADTEKLLSDNVEKLKTELLNSKQYASDEIDKMIADAEDHKKKILETVHSKIDEGIDSVMENKKELLGHLQSTSDHIKNLHESFDFKNPKAAIDLIKSQKVEMLNKAQNSVSSFIKDKYHGLISNATIDTSEDPASAAGLLSSSLGTTLNLAGGAVFKLVSDMTMGKIMEKQFYQQIEDKHGRKEVLVQKMLSGNMTPVKIDKDFREKHDKLMKDTNMSQGKREQELFKLRLEYEDQARPAIARALYLMGERDEKGEKVEGVMKQMFEFMKRASEQDFDYASFYITASDDEGDSEIPFNMQIELSIVEAQFKKEMKTHSEDLFSGKKNKEIFEYMTGKKPIPRKFYDEVKKSHIEKAHQISEEYKKNKKRKKL
jgi:hypothetical protein